MGTDGSLLSGKDPCSPSKLTRFPCNRFNLGTDNESIKEQADNYLDSALCVHLR